MGCKAESNSIDHDDNLFGPELNAPVPRNERRWQSNIRILLCLLPMILLSAQSAQAQAQIAVVVDVNGEWVLNERAGNLGKLDGIPAGGVIEFRKHSFGKSYIVIADRVGTIIDGRDCDKDDCNKPIVLPKSVARNSSALSRIFSAVVSFWRKGGDIYDTLIVRTKEGDLEEAIVTLNDGRVDLSAAFKKRIKGNYLLRFVPKGNRRLKLIDRVAFDWDPQKPSPLVIPRIKPGLYEIKLLSLQEIQPEEQDVWVLITPPGNYFKKTSAQFAQVRKETEHWGAKGFEESRRSFLRAFLGYLDAQKKR